MDARLLRPFISRRLGGGGCGLGGLDGSEATEATEGEGDRDGALDRESICPLDTSRRVPGGVGFAGLAFAGLGAGCEVRA